MDPESARTTQEGTAQERQSPFRSLPRQVPVAVDAAYVRRLATKGALLQQASARAREDVRRTRRELSRVQESLRRELGMVRAELAALRKETGAAVERVESSVNGFRRLSRAGDLARLSERVDAFDPALRMTREQFIALVRDELARRTAVAASRVA